MIQTQDGLLDRAALRAHIILYPEAKLWLEQYLHPLIRQQIAQRITTLQSPYGIIDIPLLTNTQDFPYIDRVLLIDVHPKLQLERLMQRDSYSAIEAQKMLKIQPEQHLRRALADDIIENNTTPSAFKGQLLELHQIYLNAAKSSL